LAAHLLATPIALTRAEDRELAEKHHRQAAVVLERLGLNEEDPAWIDFDEHAALFANDLEEFDDALAIQQRVLEQRIVDGDPLAIIQARMRLAVTHQTRALVVPDPEPDIEAAEAGYRQVLVDLKALDVTPGHSTRLMALLNLGLLLWTPDASPEQLDEVWTCMSAVVESGHSSCYLSAMHVLLALTMDRFINATSPAPELLLEAERLGAMLQLELRTEDLAPRDRLDTWTILTSLRAFQGDLVAFEAADAAVYELADAAVITGIFTPVERDIQLATHTMQIVSVFSFSNSELAHRYALRAAKLADAFPSDVIEKPEVASLVADIAAASNAPNDGSQR
jgi:hypothetical protein